MFDHIQNLDKSRTNWRIKARCTRFWQTVSNKTNDIKGYNFILLDDDVNILICFVILLAKNARLYIGYETDIRCIATCLQNSHIHAYAYPDNWTAIGKEVVEGNVYVIENFQVRDSTGKLKPVSNKLCIRLLSSTIIIDQPNDLLIPVHKFEFMDLGDLSEEAKKIVGDENPEFAIG